MSDLKQRYLTAKKNILEREFSRMNDMQRVAVFKTKGPLLILAGAGSGKTTVLVNRIANMIRYGDGYTSNVLPNGLTENEVDFLETFAKGTLAEKSDADKQRAVELISHYPAFPWKIMAITFTNKAAENSRTGWLPCWAKRAVMSGLPPSTPPAPESCDATATASAIPANSPFMTPTTASA